MPVDSAKRSRALCSLVDAVGGEGRDVELEIRLPKLTPHFFACFDWGFTESEKTLIDTVEALRLRKITTITRSLLPKPY